MAKDGGRMRLSESFAVPGCEYERASFYDGLGAGPGVRNGSGLTPSNSRDRVREGGRRSVRWTAATVRMSGDPRRTFASVGSGGYSRPVP